MSLTVDKCLQAWTNSLRQMDAKAEIVFYGDSLTYYGDFSAVFPDKVVCNLGLRGDTLLGMIRRIEQVQLLRPETIYLMAGTNDVSNCPAKVFLERYDNLLKSLKKHLPLARIIVQSLLPVNENDYSISCTNNRIVGCNVGIAALSIKYGIEFIDLYAHYQIDGMLPKSMTVDGIHLISSGYNKWYSVLKESVLLWQSKA